MSHTAIMSGTKFTLEVQPNIPERLARLPELANDLLYTWDRRVRGLFYRLDHELWEQCRHNPKVFLRRVAQERLQAAAEDRIFIEDYNRVLSIYDIYKEEPIRDDAGSLLNSQRDLIAYFCAEFGFHESVPIYSGGLGILAGDHCKAASDLGLPFVAVGLLYRQGYFTQTIDGQGNQIAHYTPTDFGDLPVTPARDAQGQEIHVSVNMSGRVVILKVWVAKAGHITLYLLDSDLPENSEQDRIITYQLYGGDINTRIQQEIILGIGGVRALRALGIKPNIWHINEGHAAFMILERCAEYVAEGLDFDAALELVAAGTVFTTHTPVPAGHDIFSHEQFAQYFKDQCTRIGGSLGRLMELGAYPSRPDGFNMTALALRGSRFHNGVSRIHGGVAAVMEAYVWGEVPAEENPIRYVTNGVHVPTFLAREWVNLFDMRFDREWRNELLNESYWERVDEIPNQSFWSVRQTLKTELLSEVRIRYIRQLRRNGYSEVQIERMTRYLSGSQTDILTLGFARRFATYKRATLLFQDPDRLARIMGDPHKPVLLIFAGKAHPHDHPGQDLIRRIHEFSRMPQFEGKIILLENYDLAMARKLVTGVDVWLNTPQYPLEASGTSGQKASINGVLNLSVLDGWWGEGYNGENGWAITAHGPQYDAAFRDREESQSLLDILEHQVVPIFYHRNGHGYSEQWVKLSKSSMKSLLPRFNAQRMVMDYVRDFYSKASKHQAHLAANQLQPARELAEWKKKIQRCWHGVTLRTVSGLHPEERIELCAGDSLPIAVAANLNGLTTSDVHVELLIGVDDEDNDFIITNKIPLTVTEPNDKGEVIFSLDFTPTLSGLQYYKLRMYPYHESLAHPFETGRMIWV